MDHNEILGIGVDIENIDRFVEDAGIGSHFIHLVFTNNEIEQINLLKIPAPSLSAKYAAKEAVFKALSGTGRPNLGFKEIEIIDSATASPIVKILKTGFEDINILVSYSHVPTVVIAFSIATVQCQ